MTYPGLTVSDFPEAPVIRAFRSITPAQANVVAQALASSGPWTVERHDDYDGYLTIVVSPVAPDAATFAISGTVNDIALSEMHDDELQPRGRFNTIDAALTALIELQR